jgi:1,4-alpha-glucan branching enzyme
MATIKMTFYYYPGTYIDIFVDAQLSLEGSWNFRGEPSDTWSCIQMRKEPADDGGIRYAAEVEFPVARIGTPYNWEVRARFSDGHETWAIPTEINDSQSSAHYRSFVLSDGAQTQTYYLTHCRRMGANKFQRHDGTIGVRFSVWAPNAQHVDLAFGTLWDINDQTKTPTRESLPIKDIAGGYIADNGEGHDESIGFIPMLRAHDGVWTTPNEHEALNQPAEVLNHRPYMFRVTMDDGTVAFRTDLYSRCQIGSGSKRPKGQPYKGRITELAGTGSCSVTVDPELVTQYFVEEAPYLVTAPPTIRVWPERHFIPADEFWTDEFTDRTLPNKIEDLVIYELHLGALGYGKEGSGTLEDAIALLDHLVELNVNAVELLPLAEFGGGTENWGYQTSHYSAVEYSGGGRDQFKFFVKECHRRGLAVIMDVVYNHYTADSERAEYAYDSQAPERNIYFWYEGSPTDYEKPDGGYVDNMSTGWAPRYHEEIVRKMFISSAVALLTEFHVDGLRVDQTTSIHGYNVLHADGQAVASANIFGAKLLREFGNTLRLIKPEVFLMAEDHSDWDQVTQSVDLGGMGFDARWYSDYYHHLAGDTEQSNKAKLLYSASLHGPDASLQMDWFSGALSASADQKVVYSESHDEAGNSTGPFFDPNWKDDDKKYTSGRTIVVAANSAPLYGDTRKYAEARCRFAWGVTALSAGIPMFLFGEEVGFEKRFKYNEVLENKEDINTMRQTTGHFLYRFYSDVNALRLSNTGLRSHNIEVVHVHNDNRMIAFLRWDDQQKFMVVATLADRPYSSGYRLTHPSITDGGWQEVFNSDANLYGGDNIGNLGASIPARNSSIDVVVPHAGFVVLRHQT